MADEKVKITGFNLDVIDVYKEETAEHKVGQFRASEVKLPIDVLEVAPNYMIRIKTGIPDGTRMLEGWIYATMVQTQGSLFEAIDVSPCNHALPEQVIASRNVGNNCGDE